MMAHRQDRGSARQHGQNRDRFRQIGAADRQRLEGWQTLMQEIGVTPPPQVQRYLDDPNQRVRRGAARRGVVQASPGMTPAGMNEQAYNAMLTSMGGGTMPAGAMSYQNYANADDWARLGGDPARASQFIVPTQVNNVPMVIPRGARITNEGYANPPPPQTNAPTPPLTQATRGPQHNQRNQQQRRRR
jgi:hypothetical protein